MGIELFVLSDASVAVVKATDSQLLHHDYLSVVCKQLMIDAGCHCVTWAVVTPDNYDLVAGDAYFVRGGRMIGPLMRAIDYLIEQQDRCSKDPDVHKEKRARTNVALIFVQRYFDAVYANPDAYVVLRPA